MECMSALLSACNLNTINADLRFLLAQLHMDSLLSKSTCGDIKLALRNLPRGIEGLDMMYKEAMKRIDSQEEGFRALAKKVLSWVTHAKRQLTTTELQYALAVRHGAVELDGDFVPEVEVIVSVCASLVTVDEQSGIIRWIHYTTQEYFERTWTLWVPYAQVDIASVCLAYLSFDVFAVGFCPTDEEFEARLRLNILYDYAARNWGHHARAASTEVEQLILDLLESEAKVSSSSQAMMALRSYSGYSQRVPRQITGAHLAAYFGLREAMIILLKNGHDPNSRDSYGRTPLLWAATDGREAVVKLLLAKDRVDPDSKDNGGWTPLLRAAINGHQAVVKLLLTKDGVDPDSKDTEYGRTPLSWAAENGHEAVVKLLLENGDIEPDSKDNYGQTPLSWAAGNGHEAVVKLLLEKAVDVDSKDTAYGRTPLSWAVASRHEAVVELLLEKAADVDSKDNTYGQTPLSLAAEFGLEAAVKLLLEKAVDMDSKDSKYGRTPLSWAAANGHKAVVKLLLEKAADVDSKDNSGHTPLSWAAGNGHKAVVELLVKKTDDVNSKGNSGLTPLSWAARNGYEAVVELLLEHRSELSVCSCRIADFEEEGV
jgi:ankyrin repeat protein